MYDKVTVIVTTYNRYDRLNSILRSWLLQCPNVILANGGKIFQTSHNIRQIYFNPDPGNKIRFYAGLTAETEYIILADDDFLPKLELIQDLIQWKIRLKCDFAGIIGRRFNDEPEYLNTKFFRADKLEAPEKVDFTGVCYLTDKKNLFKMGDPSKTPDRSVDDLFFQCVKLPGASKYVIPTKNYENLFPECNDPGSIFQDPASKAFRQKYYKEILKGE